MVPLALAGGGALAGSAIAANKDSSQPGGILLGAGAGLLAGVALHSAGAGIQALRKSRSAAAEGAALIRNGMPSDSLWYQKSSVYQTHVRSFMDSNGDGIGDFKGLTSKLDHVQYLGHDAIWILPFYESPLRDGGYDIANYLKVNPQYGTMEDVRGFIDEAHKRGIRVINELVLNHTSNQHEWFKDEVSMLAKRHADGITAPLKNDETRYVWNFSPKEDGFPKQWEDTRVIFQDFEPSNWTYNDKAQGWFWHRFYKEQPDLNWDNPQVVKDMTSVVDHWLDMGVDGIRLDAVPYLFERTGFQGENLTETHDALKMLRAHIDGKYADRMMLAEANMPAKQTLEYFGKGDEAHAAFNFPLMPRLFMGTLFGDKQHVIDGLKLTSEIPDGTAWMTFLRNHDEMTLEKVEPAQREAIWKMYREGVSGQGIVADPNAPINLGVRLRLSDLLGNDPNRIEMMNSMLYSQPGTPIQYYGDEIGMVTNRTLNDRDGVRTAMQWNAGKNGGFSTADPSKMFLPTADDARTGAASINVAAQKGNPDSMLERTRSLLAVRKEHPALLRGKLDIVETGDQGVVAYRRSTKDENIVAIANLTGERRTSTLSLPGFEDYQAVPIHGSSPLAATDTAPKSIELEPYGYQWIKLSPKTPG